MFRPQSRQEAELLVRQRFPDLGKAEFRVFQKNPWSIVLMTDTEVIKIGHRDGTDNMFAKEIHALRLLSGHMDGVVPRELGSSWHPPIVRTERLSGQPLVDDISHEFEIMSAWSAAEQEKVGKEIGILLARLHSIPVTEENRENIPPSGFIIWDSEYVESFEHAILARGEADAKARFENGQNFIRNYSEDGEHMVFTHMDIGPRNLIRQDNGTLGLIDFGASAVGPAYIDFVRPISFFPQGIWQAALDTYEQQTGRKIDHELLQGALDHYYSVRVICDVKQTYPEPRHIVPVRLEL